MVHCVCACRCAMAPTFLIQITGFHTLLAHVCIPHPCTIKFWSQRNGNKMEISERNLPTKSTKRPCQFSVYLGTICVSYLYSITYKTWWFLLFIASSSSLSSVIIIYVQSLQLLISIFNTSVYRETLVVSWQRQHILPFCIHSNHILSIPLQLLISIVNISVPTISL